MYKPGGRPSDLVKTEVEAQNVEPAAETPQEKTAAADETKSEKPDATTATQTSDATTEESESS